MQEIKKKIGKACVQLLLRHPFFGSLVYQHDYLVSQEVPTAGVTPDGLMLFNPDFVETCSREELMFLVAHEVMHVVFAHALRRGHRDHELYNIACDAVINEILIAEGVGKFIDGGIRMKGAEARTSESIYEELAGRIKKPKKATAPGLAGLDLASGTCSADNDGNGKGGSINGGNNKNSDKNEQSYSGTLSIKDLPESVPPMTQEQINEQISMGKINLGQAASLARARGLMSGMLGRFVDQALESKMPWHQLLERYLLNKADQRYTWSRPDKRRLNIAYLPRRERVPSMGEVVLGIDVSGSISDSEVAAFIGHCQAIFELCHPKKVYVVYCTTRVEAVDEFEKGEDIEPRKNLWCGGTHMPAIMAWIEKKQIEPDVCITFTDGYTAYPEESEVPCPLVWVLCTEYKPPEGTPGEVIYANDN